jgi:hypothetical protein
MCRQMWVLLQTLLLEVPLRQVETVTVEVV